MIEEAIDGRLKLVLFEPVIAELERVLTEKLGFESQRWREVEALLGGLGVESVEAPAASPEAVTGDRDDDLILACAIAAGVEVVVSGGRRHLLPVGERGGVRILTPQALLVELRGE